MVDIFGSVSQLLLALSENTSINIKIAPKHLRDEDEPEQPSSSTETLKPTPKQPSMPDASHRELLERLEHILDAAKDVVVTMKNHV